MKCLFYLAALMCCLAAGAETASAATKNGGLAAGYVQPRHDFAATADNGTSYGLIFDYPLLEPFGVTGNVTWYHLGSVKMTEYAVGPQLDYRPLYLGVEVGYLSSFKEWSLTPNVGLRRGMLDVSVRYQTRQAFESWALRFGVFF